jgi:hypothetical protein
MMIIARQLSKVSAQNCCYTKLQTTLNPHSPSTILFLTLETGFHRNTQLDFGGQLENILVSFGASSRVSLEPVSLCLGNG